MLKREFPTNATPPDPYTRGTGYGDIDLQTACLAPPCGVSPRHVDYSGRMVDNCPAWLASPEAARSLKTEGFRNRPTTCYDPPQIGDVRPRLSIRIVNALEVKSMQATDHERFNSSSILRFVIWRLSISFNTTT